MKHWDVFISHASEDKESVVVPLAEMLRRAGLRVWLDRQEIQLGDSLREKIDEGLAQSRFGVVILSKAFLEKGWPKRELNGLMALEESGQKVILPVWHGITKDELASYSPILADRVAANTDKGITAVAEEVDRVVSSAVDTPSWIAPTPLRRLKLLIDEPAAPDRIVRFLQHHPDLLAGGTGHNAIFGPNVLVDLPVANGVVSIAVASLRTTEGVWDIDLFGFANVDGKLLRSDGGLEQDIESQRTLLKNACVSLRNQPMQLKSQIGHSVTRCRVSGRVFARRRDALTEADKNQYKLIKGVDLATYDFILDHAAR